ncbi:hypothetical protein C6P45_004468 [Maudiozyma exigua]|uniref:Citrate synthase n=1 Tax=Maudiozyma exigua TaxID=34358 RepID=A0A9P6WAC8_MAUEX|nr:hypothetical protein C6P45_004468 [Kazachstania exigua]
MLRHINNNNKIVNLYRTVVKRNYSNSSTTPSPNLLKQTLQNKIVSKQKEMKDLRQTHSNYKIGDITIGSLLGGMRGNSLMYWDGTTLSPTEGIKFKGLTIEQCQDKLPNAKDVFGNISNNNNGKFFLPESMLWLLITGEIPTREQTLSVINLLNNILRQQNGELPPVTETIMNKLPADMHPMTQLSIGITSLSSQSKFSSLYSQGKLGKSEYWSSTFDDSMKLIANLPLLAGKIYSRLHQKKTGPQPLGSINYEMDWAYNISSMLGMTKDSQNIKGLTPKQQSDFVELMRLYTGIHVDHEGGNVSAHSTHLVGSTLADPFLSYSSGINGLAGPLHGLAAQEVVRFLFNLQKKLEKQQQKSNDALGDTDAAITKEIWRLLSNQQVIPGYGHAVLRIFDPRFDAMLNFVKQRPKEFQNDKHVNLMQNLSQIVPDILIKHGKCKNPYPNVDAASGILFYHYGITELMFFTVIFGCSRAIGPLTQLIWDRILGLPIERPKSIDMTTLKSMTK